MAGLDSLTLQTQLIRYKLVRPRNLGHIHKLPWVFCGPDISPILMRTILPKLHVKTVHAPDLLQAIEVHV